MRKITGTDVCYVCGENINWEYIPRDTSRRVSDVYMISDIMADVTAIGKKEDGKIQVEIICKCPACGIKNKYLRTV